jgi:ankyrin repeat protein
LQILVEHGADVNRRAQSDVTALIDACTNGHVDIAKFLLENGSLASQSASPIGSRTLLTDPCN